MGSGLITIFLVAHFFTPILQGYYYTFFSLIALQVFVEMGLNTAIIQIASHEKAHLEWSDSGRLTGSNLSEQKIQALLKFALYWFTTGGLLLMLVLTPVGWYFFKSKYSAGNFALSVGVPWVLLVICTAGVIVLNSFLSVLEGCGKVAEIAEIRLWQSKISAFGIWISIVAGGTLYSLSLGSLFSLCIGAVLIRRRFRDFINQYSKFDLSIAVLNWKSEILPFQWRIGLSWLSGYLIFQALTPIVFAKLGAVDAGRLGMSMQIFGSASSLAIVWVSTKAPKFGVLVAKKNRVELDTIFFKCFRQSLIVMAGGLISIAVAYTGLMIFWKNYLGRLLPWPLLLLLAITGFSNHIVWAESIYLRAHKEEPFLSISIFNGMTTLILAVILVPIFGLLGATGAYAAGSICFGLIGGTFIFIEKRKNFL